MALIKSKKEILYLEPVATNRTMVHKILEKEKVKIIDAENLDEAIEIVGQNTQIKLILTSLDVGTEDNKEIMARIRDSRADIPVVILTSKTDPGTILSIFRHGYANYITKPIVPDVLKSSIQQILNYSNYDFFGICSQLKVFDDFSVPIYMVNRKHEIIYSNRAFLSLYGFKAKDVANKPLCCDTLKYDYCKETCINEEPFGNGKVFKIRELTAHLENQTLNLFASFIPVNDSEHNCVGLIVTLADLSSEASLQGNFQELYEKEKEKTVALEKATNDLNDLNKNLEDKVELRTKELAESRREIKEVLDHIDLGIMTFDPEGVLSEGYSDICKTFFNQSEDLAGKSIYEVLSLEVDTPGYEELNGWIKMCSMVFADMPWEDIVNLSPYLDWEFGDRFFHTIWNAISKDGSLERIMMINKDVTQEKKLEQQIKSEREAREREMEVLLHLLNNSEDELVPYFRELSEKLKTLEDLINNNKVKAEIVLAYRSAHTIKGGSALLNFSNITKISHVLEDQLQTIRDSDSEPDQEVLDKLKEEFTRLSEATKELMEWAARLDLYTESSQGIRKIKVNSQKLFETVRFLEEKITPQVSEDLRSEFDEEVQYWKSQTTVECKAYFKRFIPMIESVAETRGKQVKPLQINGDYQIVPEFAEKWLDPLTHILRNAVDHGVETPECRREAGKDETAQIIMSFKINNGHFHIKILDDGGGINGEKVYQKLVSMGKAPKEELSEQEKIELIFHAGLSTADEVSDISGRGVGMDIVKSSIEAIGGSIEVTSKRGVGTKFLLSAPYHP